jgi:hypothetical protein
METLIPILGILAGIIIPVSVFIWQYYEEKGKREAIIEISRHLDDPSKADKLLNIFEERKAEPIDYRRRGLLTLSVGIGVYLLGTTAIGTLFEGAGLLVSTIGVGMLIAGYLYPNTGAELTQMVEKFEEK